jgi:hypothetical protein
MKNQKEKEINHEGHKGHEEKRENHRGHIRPMVCGHGEEKEESDLRSGGVGMGNGLDIPDHLNFENRKITFPRPPCPLWFKFFFLLLLAALVFTACPVEPENTDGGITVTLPVNGGGGTTYLSLSSGEPVSNPASAEWDIAIEAHDSSFFILTNSGVSAQDLKSGGQGAVWFTEKTDFPSVALADAKQENLGEYEAYTADTTRYAVIMGPVVKETLNVMTYLGYRSGDGTEASPFLPELVGAGGMTASYSPYRFDKKQSYSMGGGMPPAYSPTYQVYIIRHGDGTAHSKLQLADIYLDTAGGEYFFVLHIIHEKL